MALHLADHPFLDGTLAKHLDRRSSARPKLIWSGAFPAISDATLAKAPHGPCRLVSPSGELIAHTPGEAPVSIEVDPAELIEPTNAYELALAERAWVDGALKAFAIAGVRLIDPARIWVEPGVVVEGGAVLWPNTILRGSTWVKAGAEIRGATLVHTTVEAGAVVKQGSYCDSAKIGEGAAVGPMAHLRPGAVLEAESKVGNFVEMKKATLGRGAKASHLTYLGDATVGEGANIGAGTITCNYDGHGKHHTEIGAGAFIGSNSSLVAPIHIGAGAIVGAGSTVGKSVPDDALCVVRAPQRVLEGKAPRIHARNKLQAQKAKEAKRG